MEVKHQGCRALYCSAFFLFLLIPFGSVHATSGIQRSVTNYCAGLNPPQTPVPDVSGCSNSACHSSNNPSLNDLTAAGVQAQSANYAFFCPATTPPTTTPPTTTPPTTTPPTTGGTGGGTGMSGTGTSGMGFGSFRSRFGSGSRSGSRGDDDDDDDDKRSGSRGGERDD